MGVSRFAGGKTTECCCRYWNLIAIRLDLQSVTTFEHFAFIEKHFNGFALPAVFIIWPWTGNFCRLDVRLCCTVHIVWRLRGNIIRTAMCWIVWHNVYSPQHTYMSSSYRFNRLGLSHWDPYAVRRGGCLELYYCNMVQWFWWDSSLNSTTNWFPSMLWHCWFGHLACKNRPRNDLLCVEWDIKPYTVHTHTHDLQTSYDPLVCMVVTAATSVSAFWP